MKLRKTIFFKTECGFDNVVPPDMLRYDTAFVNDDFPGIVAFPKFQTKYGNFGGDPTVARWGSFGVALRQAGDVPSLAMTDAWYTYRHPRVRPHGPVDYSELVKVALTRYLAARSFEDVDNR